MIKVEVDERKQQRTPVFPRLMISDIGNIVLFSEPCVGVLLSPAPGNCSKPGFYCSNYADDAFKPFTGSVTLSEMEE